MTHYEFKTDAPNKGKYKLFVTAVDDDGIELTLPYRGWSDITGLTVDLIRFRHRNALKEIANGLERDMRQVVGLDDWISKRPAYLKRPDGAVSFDSKWIGTFKGKTLMLTVSEWHHKLLGSGFKITNDEVTECLPSLARNIKQRGFFNAKKERHNETAYQAWYKLCFLNARGNGNRDWRVYSYGG